jgi:putative ABC transport system permease protein
MDFNMWMEMVDNSEYIKSQYDVICGEINDNDPYGVILVTDSYDCVPDVTLFSLNYLDQSDLIKYFLSSMVDSKGNPLYVPNEPIVPAEIDFDELMSKRYKLITEPEYYGDEYVEGEEYSNNSGNGTYMRALLADAKELHISAIVRPKEGVSATMLTAGGIYYSTKLVQEIMAAIDDNAIVKAQIANPDKNILKGGRAFLAEKGETYEDNLAALGVVDLNKPSSIYIYPAGFKEKEALQDFIARYNQSHSDRAAALRELADEEEAKGNLAKAEEYRAEADKQEAKVVRYRDVIGNIISTISIIIDSITYVLIAFVSISLLVSSVMIGIITTISVLERTKEIGVLRAIGASKQDVTNIFISETVLIGLFAGLIGVIFTAIMNLPITAIVGALAGPTVKIVARLPIWGAFGLIGISIFLTLIAGIIPARSAARKDPVVALRSE